MSFWSDLVGIIGSSLKLGFQGITLKSSSGKLQVRNTEDSAAASVVVSVLELGGGNTILRSGGSGDITLPSGAGSPNQAVVTDGAGNWSYAAVAGGNDKAIVDTTTLSFGSAATVAMFTLPATAVIQEVRTIVGTVFNGASSMSIGISGQLSKYVPSSAVDLTTTGTYVFHPDLDGSGSSENLIVTYSVGGATAGAARILVTYVIPS